MSGSQVPARYFRLFGWLGLIGVAAAAITDVIGVMVAPVGFVADTISDLAAGPHAWIQDVGLCALAVGLLAVAFGLDQMRLDGGRWRAGALLLAALAICVFVLAVHNEYGDKDSGRFVIHVYLVYAVGLSFAVAALLMARGVRRFGRFWYAGNLWLAAAWIVAAPIFFIVPTSWDGLYERAVAALMLLWMAAASWLLLNNRPGQPRA